MADNGYENRAAKAVFNGKKEVEITLVKAPSGLDTSLNNEGFAEGFQTYQMLPKKEYSYDFEINVNMNVGTVNNGKSAYIFQKNLVTKAYECVKVMSVSEIGNVAFTTTQISDVIVLVQE